MIQLLQGKIMEEKNIKENQLREIMRLLERKLGIIEENQLSCCQITLAQCHALVEIGRAKKISLNELSGILCLDNSTMCRTVNNLVNAGLLERVEDPNDRRYINIQLTDTGLQAYKDIENKMNDYYEEIYKAIPENKQNQMLESLQILNQIFDKIKCC
jgi:DNA-binding MarR family transcriptional regulator